MKKTVKFLFIFYLITKSVFCVEITKTQLIKDLLINDNSTTNLLNVIGCWDRDSVVHFARHFSISINYYDSPQLLNKSYERHQAESKLYITDFKSCPEMILQFQKMDKFFLAFPFRWVIFIDEEHVDFFMTVDVLLSSNVILVMDGHQNVEGDEKEYELIQVYKIKEFSKKLRTEKYGYWNQRKGFKDERTSKVISYRRRDMQGELMTMVGITLDNRTYTYFHSRREKLYDPSMRMLYHLNNIIMDTFNSTKRHVLTQRFGYDETGIWVGTYGNLINGHTDLSLVPLFVQAERVAVIDYIGTLTPFYGLFIFRAPSLSSIANIYFLPFSRLVWMALGVSALICTISIFILKYFEERLLDGNPRTAFADILLLTISAICQMGTNMDARMYSSRIAFVFLFMTLVFVYTSYTASIVGLLQTSTNSIQTLEDLYKSKLRIGVEDNLYNRYYFGQSNDPIRRKIFEDKLVGFYDRKPGVALLRNSSFAYFGEERPIYREIEDTFYEEEKCGLKEMRYYEWHEPYQAVQKNSPIKEMTKIAISRLREYAIAQVEKNRLLTPKPTCVLGNGQRFDSVTLESVSGAITFYSYGLAGSFILFLLEYLHSLVQKVWKKHCPDVEA